MKNIATDIKQLIYANKSEIVAGTIAFDIDLSEFKNLKLDGNHIYKNVSPNGVTLIFGSFNCRANCIKESGCTYETNCTGSFDVHYDEVAQTLISDNFTCDIRKANY